ncbi:Uncharacterised protein [Klebsiella pneumoniae]|nr:Uncharacterised protein [Klebsiella pneumoniae]
MIAPPTALNFAGSAATSLRISSHLLLMVCLITAQATDTPDVMASHSALNFGPSVSQFCQI